MLSTDVLGNYVLGELIGRGGTSEVYAAQHRFLGEAVAIKIVRADLALDDEQRRAFVAEATKTRAVAHPNVVRVLDAGRAEDGRCYLVMELAGDSLAARLRRGPLDEAEVRRLGAAIADGMQAVHACGLVHRDLKPANVMLVGDAPKIVDFGIAKSLSGGDAAVTARTVGTLGYMAPEQLAGSVITPRVDVWSLGVILFESVTGRLPFTSFEDGACPQLVDAAPRASSLVPISRELDAIIARCLARDPKRRFATMTELAAALRGEAIVEEERVTEDLGGGLRPQASGLRSEKASGHPRRRLAWVVMALGMVGIAGAAFAWQRSSVTSTTSFDAPVAAAPDAATPDAGQKVVAVATAPLLEVDLRTTPRGAAILIDGVKRGKTPAKLSVPPGATIEVVRAGYRPRRVRVDHPGTFELDLARIPPHTHTTTTTTNPHETLD